MCPSYRPAPAKAYGLITSFDEPVEGARECPLTCEAAVLQLLSVYGCCASLIDSAIAKVSTLQAPSREIFERRRERCKCHVPRGKKSQYNALSHMDSMDENSPWLVLAMRWRKCRSSFDTSAPRILQTDLPTCVSLLTSSAAVVESSRSRGDKTSRRGPYRVRLPIRGFIDVAIVILAFILHQFRLSEWHRGVRARR